jgi:hypothetical protein
MTNNMENVELVDSHIWTIMVESGQDDFYTAGVFTDENLALSALADLSQRLEEENRIHSEYSSNRISARLVSHPIYAAMPQYQMLYTVHTLPDTNSAQGRVTFLVHKELHTTTSLFEYARTSQAVSFLLENPTKAFFDDSASDEEMKVYVTFDPDNVTFASGIPQNN